MVDQLTPEFVHDRWRPDPGRIGTYQVSRFMTSAGLDSYTELVQRAAAEPEWFYPAAMEFLDLQWMRPWTRLVDDSRGPEFTQWFPDGGTNVAWLATRRLSPDACAVAWEGDDGQTRSISTLQLDTMIARAAAGLRSLGVGRGDVVTMYLPMIPEAVVAILAVARIGALIAPAFSGYGVEALSERIELARASAVITADGFLRRGATVPMLGVAVEAVRRVSHNPHIIVVPRLNADRSVPGTLTWSELLDRGVDGSPETFDSAHPFCLAFTSGSSGPPKGVLHTHGGMPYGAAIDLAFTMDLSPGDRLCWPSDMGWLVGPLTSVVTLALGATLVLFEGVMDYPGPDRLWQLVERYQLTHLGIAPTSARILALAGDQWVDRYSLDSLRILPSTGEPWTIPAWRWLHRHVGRGRAAIINWSGGTEIGGGILGGSPIVETAEGRFAGPVPGMSADVVDDEGASITDEIGELVLNRTTPSMTNNLWHDSDRYLKTYWSRFPGRWQQGDQAIRHNDGSWELPGRSDDVIKVAGKRVGPAELEALALGVPGVALAGAVGLPHHRKGLVPVIAITLSDTAGAPTDVAAAVSAAVERAMGKPMRPEAVVVVDELPVTRSNKVHRRALRCWLADTDAGDLAALANPQCQNAVREAGRACMS
ncbi:AMP-binding protein [Mycobacterium palustre]|nr:AMP-binding protein [Mycobacterium palustre]MCV7101355.1 AMP-binding protein [Mycobacterium palustre]